jgi:hypothetical protein
LLPPGTKQGHRRQVEPDWAEIHRELKRKHVTLTMLWDEYIERCPEGYRYSRFCELYRSWASRLSVTMRQAHIGGDKLFVDYAGDTVPVIVDRLTGQVRPDRSGVDRLADQQLEQRIRAGLLDRVELAVFQVLDPRRELEPEQAAEAEHVIG